MPKPYHNRKLAFVPGVNKAKIASNRKRKMKIPSSRLIQLKEECIFPSAATPIEILKECNEG